MAWPLAIVVAVLATGYVLGQRNHPGANVPPITTPAWELRQTLDADLAAAATAAGITIEVEPSDDLPRACELPDGSSGVFYRLHALEGPRVDDLDALLSAVRESWEAKGYTVSDRAIGDVQGVSARDADGGSMYVLSGPGGTGFDGETPCSAVDGGPHALID